MLQRIFLIFFFSLTALRAAELPVGTSKTLTFTDVDGRAHSTADGRVSIIVVITRAEETRAQAVADGVPERCLGHPHYRYLTVVNFQRKIASPFQSLTKGLIRNRLNAQAARLRPEYAKNHLAHDPRDDLFVVADFDGHVLEQLGLAPESSAFVVFVFNGQGKVIARWNDVPPEKDLVRAINAAE